MKKLLFGLLIVLILCITFPPVCLAQQSYTIYRLTDNSYPDERPSVYNGTIAWQGFVNNHWEIFYWDGTRIRQITNNTNNKSPSLHAGKIAWHHYDGNDWEIFYWDGNIIHQITDNTTDDQGPSLYDGKIAWTGFDGTDSEIYLWDGSAVVQITYNHVGDEMPSLYNGTIAWQQRTTNPNTLEVYYWDGKTIRQISDSGAGGPSLYNGTIAWEGSIHGIGYWNGTSITNLRSLYGDQASGQFATLWDGTIAWQNFNPPLGLHYWDGTSVRQIDSGTSETVLMEPSLHGGILAWGRDDGNDYEIYYAKFDDSDRDGLPDVWELQYGLNPLVKDASGDKDGDRYTNLEEYKAGTDPTDANSKPKRTGITVLPLLLED